jgi:hypothetical protein
VLCSCDCGNEGSRSYSGVSVLAERLLATKDGTACEVRNTLVKGALLRWVRRCENVMLTDGFEFIFLFYTDR